MKKLFQKRNVIYSAAASLSLCLTFFFFSPIDLFLPNQKEFTVNPEYIIVPMLLTALCSAAVLFLILLVIGAVNKKLFNVSVCLVFGVLCAIYCQILFFNGRMQVIDGGESDNSGSTVFNYFNLGVLYVLLVLPLILLFAKRRAKNEKLKFVNIKTFFFLTSLTIIMQAVGTGGLLAQNKLQKFNRSAHYEYLSFEPILSMSKENNIIVIILDRLDTEWMEETLDSYPDVAPQLTGFTFYQDNVSRYFSTFPSVAQMLTGTEYSNEHRKDYRSFAWAGETVPDKLIANGYRFNALIDSTTTFSSFSDLSDRCDNYIESDFKLSYNYLGKDGIIRTMLRLSAAKTLPCFFKWIITDELSFDFSRSFSYIDRDLISDALDSVISDESDHYFYEYLQENKVTADSEKPCYSFIHLNGPHDVSALISNQYDDNTYDIDRMTTIRGDLESIFCLFDQMKELGIYDNSTIIILGDHGRFRDFQVKDEITRNINTGLLIKPRGASGDLVKDGTTQMSNEYLPASIMEYAGLDHSEYGYSFNDIIKDDIHIDRYTSLLIYEDTLYKINGSSLDFDNWEIVYKSPDNNKEWWT